MQLAKELLVLRVTRYTAFVSEVQDSGLGVRYE